MAIIADDGVLLVRDFRQTQVVAVRGIAAGQSLVLHNIRFLVHLYVADCAGRVHLGQLSLMSFKTAGVTCDGSDVTISRDTTVSGGALTGFSASALLGAGTAHLVGDPRATLIATGGAPLVAGFTTVSLRRPPAVLTRGGALGQPAGVDLLASQGGAHVLLVSGLRATPFTVAPFGGEAWLQLSSLSVLDVGRMPASGTLNRSWTTPNLPVLRGGLIALQALAGPVSRGADFSNPGVYVMR